jgi:hypothetical protein
MQWLHNVHLPEQERTVLGYAIAYKCVILNYFLFFLTLEVKSLLANFSA